MLDIKGIGEAFEEQHAEDVILKFAGIHVAAQDIRCFPEELGRVVAVSAWTRFPTSE